MGNRAVITNKAWDDIGIYLHWNGGRNSIEQFLAYAKHHDIRDDDYGLARLVQIIGNFMGGTMSVGVGRLGKQDCNNYDNGTYWIKDWEIVDREFHEYEDGTPKPEQEGNERELYKSVCEVNQYAFEVQY